MPDDTNDINQAPDNLQIGTVSDGTNTAAEPVMPIADAPITESPAIEQTLPPVVAQEAQVLPLPTKKKVSKKILLLIAVVLALLAGAAVWLTIFKKDKPINSSVTNQEQTVIKRFGVTAGLVEGTAEYSTDKGKSWQKLAADTDLKEGNQVKTAADGRVVLLIDDGSAVRLANTSSLELTSLDTKSIVITNISGETYSRVVPAASRQYQVVVAAQTYVAKGTAFRTVNTDTKKGVEVFHSAVAVKDSATEVPEGNSFFALTDQKEKENKVSAIDLSALKKDAFMKWNSEQDKKDAEYVKSLGVLAEIDKPDPVVATPTPTPTQKTGIVLSSSVSEYSANFSWKVTGIDTAKGYKLVKSKTSQTPTYPNDSAAYIEAGKTSYNLYLGDGKTYYFRICAYRGDSCDSYSNVVTVKTAVKPKEQIVSGAVTLAITGATANWTFTGTAPYGFKLVMGTTTAPTYPAAFNKFADGTSAAIPDGLVSGTTYYARVCKYNDGACVDYSNEVTYLAP